MKTIEDASEQEAAEITEMIRRYDIIKVGDKICARNVQGISEETKRQIIAAKPAIMAYLTEQETQKRAAHEAKIRRETDYLDSVPGLRELETAQAQWAKYKDAFDRAWESGSGIYPQAPFKADHLEQLRALYSDAAWILKIQHESIYTTNYELHDIAKKTYESLQAGTSVAEAKSAYNKAHSEFVQAHAWD
jgi:hypothetical protein